MRITRSVAALLAAGMLAGCVSLKRTPEARFFTLRPVAERPAEERATAGARACQAEQQLDRGRLARAVRTQEPDDLPRPDAQVQRFERNVATVRLAQATGLDHGIWVGRDGYGSR